MAYSLFFERGFEDGVALFYCPSSTNEGDRSMYQVYNRENGWHIFTERRLASFLGRIFSHYAGLRNMTVSIHGGPRQDVTDWLERHLPPPDQKPFTCAEYFVRTAARPSRVINTSCADYYCALLCLVQRDRDERQALLVEIRTYKLGDRDMKTRHVNAQTLFSEFQKRLIELVRDEKQLSQQIAAD